jgi:hypothetical protein
MSKEQSQNLNELPEEEVWQLLDQARRQENYQRELELCIALYRYEGNPCLASTYIKELTAYLAKIAPKE